MRSVGRLDREMGRRRRNWDRSRGWGVEGAVATEEEEALRSVSWMGRKARQRRRRRRLRYLGR